MRATHWLLTVAALSASVLVTESALADGTDACGAFSFDANTKCEVLFEGGCTANCTPVTVDARCHADLSVTCDATCDELPSIDCTASCNTDCTASCMGNAQFDCGADCQVSCEGDCAGNCSASANKAQCEASCKASCGGTCDAKCEGTASGSCEAKCKGSCDGQCTVDKNIDCQVECQSSGYAECTAKVEGGCEAACSEPEGALFCDGQYVDVGSLDDCLAQLVLEFNIKADGYAYGECNNGVCEGTAGGSVSCSTSPIGSGDYALGAFGLLGLVGLGLGLSRRRFIKQA